MNEARGAQGAEVQGLRAQVAALEQRLKAQGRAAREQSAALQRALEERQALLTREKAVMDTALDCIVAMDHEGRVVDFNPAAERTFGYSREEAVGRVMADLIIPPALRSAHRDGLARYLATGEAKVLNRRLELSAIGRDGAEFPVELTITRVPADGPPLFFGYLRDITERRVAEESLRQHAGRLRSLADAALIINSARAVEEIVRVITDQARDVIGAHQAVTSLSQDGSCEQTVSTVSLSEGCASPPARVIEEAAVIAALVCDRKRPIRLTERQLESDAGWRSLTGGSSARLLMRGCVAVPLVGRNGRTLGAIQLSDRYAGDFTQNDEAVLVQLAQMASVAIENARLVEEAERARAEAEDANHAKSKFLAGMSHELRTPLNAIDGYAALLEDDIAGPLTEMQRDYVARVRRSQKHLLGLIDGVLNFTRIEAGRVEFEITDVLLAEVVREVIAMIEPQVRARNINFDRVTSGEVMVRADREKLVQVLLNLVSNAVKFTDPHGEISMACAQDSSSVHVSVSDTGIGIPADKLEAVFEPFVQVQRTHVAEGTGLGLTVSRDLARAMGGDLTVSSVLGEGSTFTLTLPLARAPVQ